jgi:hypothetical protein
MKRLHLVVSGIGLSLALAAAPSAVHADTPLVRTVQVVPPSATSTACAPLQLLSVTPHITNNVLESFDVVVSNPNYVALIANAGTTAIPFNYMTRWQADGGSLRIHVDVPSTSLGSSLPVSMTLLASPQGSPTCLASISFNIAGTGAAPTQSQGSTGNTSNTPADASNTSSESTSGLSSSSNSSAQSSSSTSTGTTSILANTMQNRLQRLCTGSSTYELWFVLLALFIVITALTALIQPPLAARSYILPPVLILVPLVLLLGFWYFAPLCRTANWIPLVMGIVAIVGIAAAFREQASVATVIQLPPAKK